MKLMLKHLKKYIPFALLASLFMVAEVYVDLFQPRMMEVIVDDGILGLHNGGKSDIDIIIHTGIIIDIIFIVWKTNPLFLLLQKYLDGVNSVVEEKVSAAKTVTAYNMTQFAGQEI